MIGIWNRQRRAGRIKRSMETKGGVDRCPKCGTTFDIQKVKLEVTNPREYGVIGFRAVVGVPCPGCASLHWIVMEVVYRGNARLYREMWEVGLQTQDLIPYDSELSGGNDQNKTM